MEISKMWVEKYRPKILDEISHQDEVVSVLKRFLLSTDMPSLLFYGPAGTGKTSVALALCREFFGTRLMKDRVMELNASDERGIDIVRNKIKNYAKVSVSSNKHFGPHPCPPFKIIILDEADAMTSFAQHCLRRTMEQYAKVTRFILICNYISRIIDPIASRCSKFRFKPLPSDSIITRIQDICQKETLICSIEAINEIVKVSNGDLRKAVTILQNSSLIHIDDKNQLAPQDIQEVACVVPDEVIQQFIIFSKNTSVKYTDIEIQTKEVISNGYLISSLIEQFHLAIVEDEQISNVAKGYISLRIAEIDKKICDGADEFLQFMDLLTYTNTQLKLHTPD